MRAGDGRSSSSSGRSLSSSSDSSLVTTATDVSSVSSQDDADELTPLSAGWVGSGFNVGVAVGGVSMGRREEPDGCSISSGSVDLVTSEKD